MNSSEENLEKFLPSGEISKNSLRLVFAIQREICSFPTSTLKLKDDMPKKSYFKKFCGVAKPT